MQRIVDLVQGFAELTLSVILLLILIALSPVLVPLVLWFTIAGAASAKFDRLGTVPEPTE